MYKITKNNGYVILLTVLVVGAVAVTAAAALLIVGVDSAKNANLKVSSHSAGLLADACAEEALEVIRESLSFSGYGSLGLGESGCSYFITKLSGQNRTIVASSTVGGAARAVRIKIDRMFPIISIVSWQETAN